MHAFMLYIDDWLSSAKIEMMDAAEERGYLRLLLRAAKEHDCGLPDDEAILAKLSLLGPQWFKATAEECCRIGNKTSGEKLRECFVRIEGKPGRIYNERLLKEWNRHQEITAQRQANGRLGGRPKTKSKANYNHVVSPEEPYGKANDNQTETNLVGDGGVGISNTENTSKNSVVPISSRHQFGTDKAFIPFVELARKFWTDLIDEDLQEGWNFWWRKFDWEQKALAVSNLKARIENGEDSRYVKRPPKYFESGDWKRRPREPTAIPVSTLTQRAMERERAMLED